MFAMNTKRRREDNGNDDFGDESSCKRFRSVDEQQISHGTMQSSFPSSDEPFQPLHTHTPTHTPSVAIAVLQAMTPAPSECAYSPDRFLDGQYRQSAQLDSTDMDMDMDMGMDDDDEDENDNIHVGSQPAEESPFGASLFMRPPMLNTSLSEPYSQHNTGRIPTPIYANFNRGKMNGLGFPISGSAGGMNLPSIHTQHQQPTWQTSRQTSRQDKDEDRSRRMPSPISEDEDTFESPIELTQSQMSRLSVSFDEMDTEADTEGLTRPVAPPTPRSGRKRSGAFTGTGRLVMGFRDDCDKCRLRVPGHYSHFLPS